MLYPIPNEAPPTVLITPFDYDITADPLPDLLVRNMDNFRVHQGNELRGDVWILNQGTADAFNVPVRIDYGGFGGNPGEDLAPGTIDVAAEENRARPVHAFARGCMQ